MVYYVTLSCKENKFLMSRNSDILETPYPPLNITQKGIEKILRHPSAFRGHVRTAMGKIYTNNKFKERSDSVLSKKLP